MRLAHKSYLVTGATSGIGRAATQRLVAEGAHVLGVGREKSRLTSMADRLGAACTPILLDLTSDQDLVRMVDELPPINGAVMSAGIVKNNPVKFFKRSVFDEIMAINLIAPLILSVELANRGKLLPGSSIVFLSSITGTSIGMKGTLAYATTKAGLTGAAKVLALELSGKNIRVNCVAPGMVDTPMVDNARELSAEMIQTDKARYPLGKRYASPEEISNVIAFLLSDESSFITGQTVTIDGGYCIQ